VDNYQKNLQVVDASARTYGFQPFYFWYPTRSVGKKPLTAEERDFVRRDLQRNLAWFQLTQAIYEICSKIHRLNYFYLGNALDDERGRFYLNDAHLTPEGNEIMVPRKYSRYYKTKTNASPWTDLAIRSTPQSAQSAADAVFLPILTPVPISPTRLLPAWW
jgi:hypothetical protein